MRKSITVLLIVLSIAALVACKEEPMHEHTWVEEITVNPTCTTEGEKTTTCTGCGETKTEGIPALSENHTYPSEWSYRQV